MRYIIGKLSYEEKGIRNIEGGSFRILDPEEVAVHKDEIKRLKVMTYYPPGTETVSSSKPTTISRKDLEYLVYHCLKSASISMSKGRSLLGFRYMEEMREWYNNKSLKEAGE
jgi:hypothetical protein